MATCIQKTDREIIVEGIQDYPDIRIRRQSKGSKWEADVSDDTQQVAASTQGYGSTRCGAVWNLLFQRIGDAAEQRDLYDQVSRAIQLRFSDENRG